MKKSTGENVSDFALHLLQRLDFIQKWAKSSVFEYFSEGNTVFVYL